MGEEVSGAGTFERRGEVAGGPGTVRWLSRAEVGRGGLLRVAASGGRSAAGSFSMVFSCRGAKTEAPRPKGRTGRR